ncbi:TetR/AcrR family transcriptional regulator [Mycobacterium sp. DL592]|uniref:TetR/AcrR family transcriptional regulator n=1 Tax=Mycobacterium sp. DL592 TaxID=2675524 RepID=UPI0014227845|nr:TetR/AcrR family transcriptional regulator [Mycobacterium sp. DL592]
MPTQPLAGRQAAAAETRTKLIDAGLRLAERTGLTGLSVNLVVDEAGVSKGSFFHHFGDRASYLLALHREFHDRIAEQVAEVSSGLPPGRERLLAGSLTYLDYCLKQRGIRALLLEARAEPAVAQEISRRNATFATVCAEDFETVGRRQPLQCANLWVAMTAEAALIELQDHSQSPGVRAALEEFLG